MIVDNLVDKIARMGARVAIDQRSSDRFDQFRPLGLDIRRDGHGEYFLLQTPERLVERIDVLDVQPKDRHLLLLIRRRRLDASTDVVKQKFLCGHDERAWFVAAVPEEAGAATVNDAKEALKPAGVIRELERRRVSARDRNKRKNRAFVRQGEWFFVPRPEMSVDPRLVITHEPLRRANGKPHMAEFCYRTGGETVYVSSVAPSGLTEMQLKQWRDRNPQRSKRVRWIPMKRNAGVYVRGRVRHSDHKTIVLQGWHEVLMNTENRAIAMRSVVFLD